MIPKIGDTITNEKAIALCLHYGFDQIAQRIKGHPTLFNSWVFDGASMTPDKIASEILHIPHLTEIALRHDLKYAYGYYGDDGERMKADFELGIEFLTDGASSDSAWAAVTIIHLLGGLPSSFGWGFARSSSNLAY